MGRGNSRTTKLILDVLKENTACTAGKLCKDLEERHNLKLLPGLVSSRLFKLWRRKLILRSLAPINGINGRKEYVYSYRDAHNKSQHRIKWENLRTSSHKTHVETYFCVSLFYYAIHNKGNLQHARKIGTLVSSGDFSNYEREVPVRAEILDLVFNSQQNGLQMASSQG
jgi:hypothetical protein